MSEHNEHDEPREVEINLDAAVNELIERHTLSDHSIGAQLRREIADMNWTPMDERNWKGRDQTVSLAVLVMTVASAASRKRGVLEDSEAYRMTAEVLCKLYGELLLAELELARREVAQSDTGSYGGTD